MDRSVLPEGISRPPLMTGEEFLSGEWVEMCYAGWTNADGTQGMMANGEAIVDKGQLVSLSYPARRMPRQDWDLFERRCQLFSERLPRRHKMFREIVIA